jgi:hypothetical protein
LHIPVEETAHPRRFSFRSFGPSIAVTFTQSKKDMLSRTLAYLSLCGFKKPHRSRNLPAPQVASWAFDLAVMRSQLKDDRRIRQRFSINAPLTLLVGDRQIPAYTRNLSNRGVYFYLAMCDGELVDTDLEFVVELPPEVTLSTCCRIHCRGRVVRKEKTADNLTGVAAEIIDYSILRQAPPVV